MRCGYVLALVWGIARDWGHTGSYRLCLRPIRHSLDATCLCANVCYSIFAQLVVLFLRFELRLHGSSTLCAVCCNRTVIAQASRRLVRDSRLGDCLKFLDELQLLAPTSNFQNLLERSLHGSILVWFYLLDGSQNVSSSRGLPRRAETGWTMLVFDPAVQSVMQNVLWTYDMLYIHETFLMAMSLLRYQQDILLAGYP